MNNNSYQLVNFAATNYGEGAYDTSVYGSCSNDSQCSSTTQDTGILAPLTGFVREQPPYVLVGLALFVVVIIALTTKFILSRKKG